MRASGYCYVDVSEAEATALLALNGQLLRDKPLRVEAAKGNPASVPAISSKAPMPAASDTRTTAGTSRSVVQTSAWAHLIPRIHTPMIDIGLNLINKQYRDPLAIMEDAQAHNVTNLILTGTSLSCSQSCVSLAARHPEMLSATVGIHPHDAKRTYIRSFASCCDPLVTSL